MKAIINNIYLDKENLSIRDHFAAIAFKLIIPKFACLSHGDIAEEAYSYADAMITERNKIKEKE